MKTLIFILLLAPIASVAQDFVRIEKELLKELNWRRAKNLRPPVRYDSSHQRVTDKFAMRIVKQYYHAGGEYRGEVIGQFIDEKLILQGFFDSPKHKKALLDIGATRVCIAAYKVPEKTIKKGNTTTFIAPLYYVVIRTYSNAY